MTSSQLSTLCLNRALWDKTAPAHLQAHRELARSRNGTEVLDVPVQSQFCSSG